VISGALLQTWYPSPLTSTNVVPVCRSVRFSEPLVRLDRTLGIPQDEFKVADEPAHLITTL